jgi:hypothetical protein
MGCSYCSDQTGVPDAQFRWFFVKMGTHLWRCSNMGRHSLFLWPKKRQHWKPVLQFKTQIFELCFSDRMGEKRNVYNFLCGGNVLGIIHLEDRERDKRLTLRWMFRSYFQRRKMDGTGSGSPPGGGLRIRIFRIVESTDSFQDLIKKTVLRKQDMRNEGAWNWLRIVLIGGLFYLC